MRNPITLVRVVLCSLALTATARTAVADECPQAVPESSKDRRAIAKTWFGKAEAAEAAGNSVDAIKAYQCSLKMVPHAFTAFNLARVAEKTGDLELAVEAYDSYLKLAPEAQDRVEVEGKVTALTARISKAREASPKPAGTGATSGGEPGTAKSAEPDPSVPQRQLSEEPMRGSSAPPGEKDDGGGGSSALQTTGWVVAGAGAVALAAGLVLNIGARGSMDDCRKLARAGQLDSARTSCDSAKPKAYASYALIGVGPAAIAAGLYLALVLGKNEGGGTEMAVAPLTDGAAVTARWRF